MVAKITSPARILAALNYNENKLKEGKAECLHAAGYLREAKEMNFHQKLEGFERRNVLSDVKTKTLHISLNFDPSEKISNERLVAIATDYMEKIGFGAQPWIVYKHKDAGHPHIHIVTTTIEANGKRINTFNIGRNQSDKARKEIEQTYGLVRAEDQKRLLRQSIASVHIEKIGYGKTETRKSISNVVNAVLNTYRYSSLAEFNAILKAYNVVADRGQEDSRIFKRKGLVYRVLDGNGNKVGVPIKASLLSSKPTLEKLEALFEKNKPLKQSSKAYLKNTLDQVLEKQPRNIASFMKQLADKNVATVLRQNEEGRIYGITFVDRNNRCVFNGSDVGKQYSAAHLEEQLKANSELPVTQSAEWQEASDIEQNKILDLLDAVLTPMEEFNLTPHSLLKKKRKRKQKLIRH